MAGKFDPDYSKHFADWAHDPPKRGTKSRKMFHDTVEALHYHYHRRGTLSHIDHKWEFQNIRHAFGKIFYNGNSHKDGEHYNEIMDHIEDNKTLDRNKTDKLFDKHHAHKQEFQEAHDLSGGHKGKYCPDYSKHFQDWADDPPKPKVQPNLYLGTKQHFIDAGNAYKHFCFESHRHLNAGRRQDAADCDKKANEYQDQLMKHFKFRHYWPTVGHAIINSKTDADIERIYHDHVMY